MQMAPTADRISEIQAALAKSGSYQGDPTGKWDDSTVAAMKHFQQSNGLSPTGKLDALSLQKLGFGSDVAGKGAPRPVLRPTISTSTSSTSHRN
jgi:peptidoglycan hydrolase-like protein with peptidoglycan-binding domain